MTFSYTPPGADGTFADPVSEVRLLIGDTKQAASSLTDEEIRYFLAATKSGTVFQPRLAAALAADQLADRFELQAGSQVKVGPFEVQRDWAAIAEAMRNRAADLRDGDATSVITPIVPAPSQPGPVFQMGMTSPGTYWPSSH